ncbi:probable RNA-binding protein EIF1AD [Cloeon dipterum]|uniref:probable RNA-binding protein EIF1AD n=1 Tax=Cloeon dipterum TaxID=197152 RepID=UPI00321FFC8D
MSKMTKKKYVYQEVEDCNVEVAPNHEVVKVLGCRGNNLHEVATAKGEKYLASMPTKFRRTVWVKRGDYVIVEHIEEGVKVKGEISRILYKDHINQLSKDGVWPEEFADAVVTKVQDSNDIFVNQNRVLDIESDSEEEDDIESCSEEEDGDASAEEDRDNSSSEDCDK